MENNKSSFIEILKKEEHLIYQINGNSMLPLLREGVNQVRLEPSKGYKLYDVVLFLRKDEYVLHRIIKVKKDYFIIMGDNTLYEDKVYKSNIIAKMTGYYDGDRFISIDDKEYRDYLNKYIISVNPYKKKIIKPNDINRRYTVNEAVKAAYRTLFTYSVLPSSFNVEPIKRLSKDDFYNFYLLTVYKKSDHVLSDIVNKYKLDIDSEIKEKLDKLSNILKNRLLFQDYYKNEISNLFKEHQIKHIYFRGSLLRDRFINPLMRMSNDIDIYVDKSDLERAERLIIEKYNPHIYQTLTVHHTYNLPQGHIQVELHYALLEEYLDNVNKVIGDPFLHSKVDKSNPYLYFMDPKYYYTYHLAHFAKHIREGEYWLSMLQDTYLLRNDKDGELLKEANIYTFNQTVTELVNYYLTGGGYNARIKDLESIIYKDAFDNYVLLNKKKFKNKFFYILRRTFLTPKELTTSYPAMRGRVFLYPYYFFKRLFSHKKNKPSEELKTYDSLKKEDLNRIYKNIGINF